MMLSLDGCMLQGFLENKKPAPPSLSPPDVAPFAPLPSPPLLPEPPHVILRQGLIGGGRYKTLAADMGTYLARTLFFSSALHLSGSQMKAEISRWSSNWPMCELTEKVIVL